MVKPMPPKRYRPDVDPLDNLQFRKVVVNPKNPPPTQQKFGDRHHRAAICNRCGVRLSFYRMNTDEYDLIAERKDRQFVTNSLMQHLRQFHGDGPFNTLDQEFILVGVRVLNE